MTTPPFHHDHSRPDPAGQHAPQQPLTCREVLDFLMHYLDGDLQPGQRREFERHLAACPSCVNYVESYKTTVQLGKAAMLDCGDPSAAAVPEGLVRAVRNARTRNG